MSEALNDYFTPEELPEVEKLAQEAGLAEQMESIKKDPEYRLVKLEEQVQKAPDNFVARFEAWKKAVLKKEADSSNNSAQELISAMNPAEVLSQRQEEMTTSFREELAEKSMLGGVALIALDWMKDSQEIAANPEATVTDRGFAFLKSIFGKMLLGKEGGEMYKKYQADFKGLSLSSVSAEEEQGDEALEENNENSNTDVIKYTAGLNVLLGISQGESENVYNVLAQDRIKKQSYKKLAISELPEDSIGLGDEYSLPGRDKEIHEAFSLLKGKEKYLDKFFSNRTDFDWRNKSIENVVLELYKFGKIFENLEGISPKELLSGKFNLFTLFEFDENNENDKGSLAEILENRRNDPKSKLHEVDNDFLIALYGNTASGFTGKKDYLMGIKGANEAFINDITDFQEKLPSFISNNFFAGKESAKEEFDLYFQTYDFNQRDILQLYILSNGSQEISTLNNLEQGLIFMKIFKLIGINSLVGNTYGNALKEAIQNNNSTMINALPEGLPDILKKILLRTGKEALSKAGGLVGAIWGSFDNAERVIYGGLALVVGAGIYRLGKWVLYGKILATGVGIGGVAMIYNEKKNDPTFDAIFEKHGITDEESFEKAFMADLENIKYKD